MKKLRIGFGIIAYDKFEEVKICADIIKGFDKSFHVVACSNHPDGKKELAKYQNIDEFLFGADTPWNHKVTDYKLSHFALRTAFNIQIINTHLVKNSKLDYCVMLHSDSWFFDIDVIYSIIKTLQNKKKAIAYPSVGLGYANKSQVLGNVMDMFIIYDRKQIQEHRVFDYDPFEILPHKVNSHGMLSIMFMAKLGSSKIHLFADPSDQYFWKYKRYKISNKSFKDMNHLRPCIYFPKEHMTHINSGSFPDNLGLAMQAYYLEKYGIKGPTVDTFVQTYRMNPDTLFARLDALDAKVAGFLARRLLTYRMFGIRDYVIIQNFYKNASLPQAVMRSVRAWVWVVLRFLEVDKKIFWTYNGSIEDLSEFYEKFVVEPKKFEKMGHKLWYKDFKS